jgi:hypothetical protein
MLTIWMSLTGTGGLLRVRALLALGLTGFGGVYLLLNEALPPEAFTVLWALAIRWYFESRGNGS